MRYQRTNAELDVYVYHEEDNSVRVTDTAGVAVAVTTFPLHDHNGKVIATVVTFPNGETTQLGGV